MRTVAVVERADGALDGFDLVQAYDREGLPAQAILASRGDPPAEAPEGMPILLDLPFGSSPGRPTFARTGGGRPRCARRWCSRAV